MKKLVFIILAFMMSVSAGAFAEEQSAQRFVEEIYARYREPGSTPNTLGKAADTIFDSATLGLIRADQKAADGEAGALDFDPLCACQDFSISRLKITPIAESASRARYTVRFHNLGKGQRVILTLVREHDLWRVSDVESSLTKSLRAYLQKNAR